MKELTIEELSKTEAGNVTLAGVFGSLIGGGIGGAVGAGGTGAAVAGTAVLVGVGAGAIAGLSIYLVLEAINEGVLAYDAYQLANPN